MTLTLLLLAPYIAAGGEIASGVGRMYASVVMVGLEELARFGFARRADNKARALLWFFILINLVEFVGYYAPGYPLGENLLARTPAVALHAAASMAFLWAFRRPRSLWPVLLTVTALHIAFDYYAPAVVEALVGG